MKKAVKANEYILYDDYAEIVVYDTFGTEKTRGKIDIEDLGLVSKYRWWYHKGYLMARRWEDVYKFKGLIPLHRLVMGAEDSSEKVYFLDRNTLDCRKHNLFKGNYSELRAEYKDILQDKRITIKSPFRGLNVRSKRGDRWELSIKVGDDMVSLGYYGDYDLDYAFLVRLKAEKIVNGKNSPMADMFCMLDGVTDFEGIKTLDELRHVIGVKEKEGFVPVSSRFKETDIQNIKNLKYKMKFKIETIALLYGVHKTVIEGVLKFENHEIPS